MERPIFNAIHSVTYRQVILQAVVAHPTTPMPALAALREGALSQILDFQNHFIDLGFVASVRNGHRRLHFSFQITNKMRMFQVSQWTEAEVQIRS
jgi:hypothetical protein